MPYMRPFISPRPQLSAVDIRVYSSFGELPMKSIAASFVLLMGLAACVGPFAASPGGGLMYQLPDTPELVYFTGDTTNVDIDAGPMGSLRMRGTGTATLAMAFERGAEGIQVTATFRELNARLSQPMGGAQTADEDDLEGPLVFTLDKKGHATLVSLPEMKGQAAELASPHAIAYQFFPLLPGGMANPGDSWTDTIHFEDEVGQGELTSTTFATYTLQGDTVVDGVNLLSITMEGNAEVVAFGVTEGMEVTQIFAGDISGSILWDPARSVYVSGIFEQDMSGTVEVPAAGMPPMPLTVRGTSHVRLQGN